MNDSLEFILRRLDLQLPAFVGWEDLEGRHGPALRLWQRLGFLADTAEPDPVPSCPYCLEGTPYLLGGKHICTTCCCIVELKYLWLWRFHLEVFLAWLAREFKLRGEVRALDDHLWRLGSTVTHDRPCELFFRRTGPLSGNATRQMLSFRHAVLLETHPGRPPTEGFAGDRICLSELLRLDDAGLEVRDWTLFHSQRDEVLVDESTGAIWSGGAHLGDILPGTREFHLLAYLARQPGQFVSYADLKEYVLWRTGGRDTTDEHTFCQRLKHRLRQRVPALGRLIGTTNKGDGYRLTAR